LVKTKLVFILLMDGGRMGVMLRVSQCLVEGVVEGVFVDCMEKTLAILLECVVELGNSGNMGILETKL